MGTAPGKALQGTQERGGLQGLREIACPIPQSPHQAAVERESRKMWLWQAVGVTPSTSQTLALGLRSSGGSWGLSGKTALASGSCVAGGSLELSATLVAAQGQMLELEKSQGWNNNKKQKG